MLRPAFLVGSISHCSSTLSIIWKDGVESVYPSTWLRASVRDDRFFDSQGLMHQPSHAAFITSPDVTLRNATVTSCELLTIICLADPQ